MSGWDAVSDKNSELLTAIKKYALWKRAHRIPVPFKHVLTYTQLSWSLDQCGADTRTTHMLSRSSMSSFRESCTPILETYFVPDLLTLPTRAVYEG